ncbi:uncharacterized protein B0H64DRAFT_399777 [Chaetomium fimeti]|uniref:GPI inositol-deacylase n=1 Tax=Chaetomium fimeti TaxID=1854472 RepID=A0AAE0LR19_9PEZI|nr:hypothetical protein B0H64DRAFT_399777 [Chaetomium fimeti]
MAFQDASRSPVNPGQTADASSELPPHAELPAPPLGSSFIRRGLKSFSFSRKKTGPAEPQDTWGPLGLRVLHSPPNPLIDVIFVHGLRGGSVKTWCSSEDLQLFWPEAWLPRETHLQDARIHSFGYNSDWGNTTDTSLDLQDFGRALLGEMWTSPVLVNGKETPILLVGHSMGGLVIKKAYILARQSDRTRELAGRIRCMFFLATPHHGSDYANLLNSILRASTILSPKQYVADIARDSAAITLINDEFEPYVEDLRTWSFYETIKTRIGVNYGMVVEKSSAVIGHKNEITHPVNADHRNICKFDSPSHPNYVLIRNCLVHAAQSLLGDALKQRADEIKLQMTVLGNFLQTTHSSEDDLNTIESKKTKGSCHWLTSLDSFKDWQALESELPVYHWLTGQAGVGKSVLTTHVIRHLRGQGVVTCYYFFRHGQEARQTTSSLLRALAFQLALLHPPVRETLFAIQKAGVRLDKDDERAIWQKLFANGIFQVPISTTQYWVIDGLDECVDSERLLLLLQTLASNFSIRIFFSSRRLPDLEKHVTRSQSPVYRHHITREQTKADIKQFVENNSAELPVDPERRPALTDKLVDMSNGAFLWAELALDALRGVFGEEEIETVLSELPTGMTPLYGRILESMGKNRRQVRIIKAILEWTVCGVRPLSTTELHAILDYDLGSKVLSMERAVEELCGQLLQINNGRVQMIHATAREFLLGETSNLDFRVDQGATNEHLATVCLKYLTSDEMRPPRHPALLSKRVPRSVFVDYACTYFSEHLVASSSSSDELLLLVDKFLGRNVLSWVEYIARERQDLYHITRACKNIQGFLERRKPAPLPLEESFRNVDEWRTDLSRIALKFGDNILQDPPAVYFLLPSLCPANSRIHKQFAPINRGWRLSGLSNASWDDCICFMDHRQSRAMSLASCDGLFAIGFKSGVVRLYQQSTYQVISSLNHGEPVKILKFSNSSHLVASGGYRHLKMWSVTGELLWSIPHGDPLSAIAFTEGDQWLVVANKHNTIITLEVNDGTRNRHDEDENAQDLNLKPKEGSWQIVISADICPRTELLTVARRGRPPEIWSIEADTMITTCHLARDKPNVPIMSASRVLFNPNRAIELLAVSYQDGELAIFDTWAGGDREVKSLSADSLTLAATADGRTLASGDGRGTIKLWDFESLTLLYCIKSTDYEVRTLAFSGDGLHLYDIRDTKTKIWEPAVLVHRSIHDQDRFGELAPPPAPAVGRHREVNDIMTIHGPPDAGCIFAGMDDGSVVSYDWETGHMVSTLYSHRRYTFVTSISWNPFMIASSDATNKIEVHSLGKSLPGIWSSAGKQFEKVAEGNQTIQKLLLHPRESWLLVLQARRSMTVDLRTGQEYPIPAHTGDDHRAWAWLCQTPDSTLLLGARACEVDIRIFDKPASLDDWRDRKWHPTSSGKGLEQPIDKIEVDKQQKYIAILLEAAGHDSHVPRLLVYGATYMEDETEGGILTFPEILSVPALAMKTFLGFYGSRIVYLDHRLWIRTIDLSRVVTNTAFDAVPSERYTFIPPEYVSGNNGVDGAVTGIGSVVFPKDGEMVVLRNLFKWPFTAEPAKLRASF